MRFLKSWVLAGLMVGVGFYMTCGQQPTLAQSPQALTLPVGPLAFAACNRTNYVEITANALGITPTALLADTIGGQSLPTIAQARSVPLQTVIDAVQKTWDADVDRAVAAGILTQQEETVIEAAQSSRKGSSSSNGSSNGSSSPRASGSLQNTPQALFPDIGNLGNLGMSLSQPSQPSQPGSPEANIRSVTSSGFIGFGFFGATLNQVKPYAVAAQALNLKCGDLVKILLTTQSKSIASVGADEEAGVQVVSGALTTVYTQMLARLVTDGVITQAQAAQGRANLPKAVTAFVTNTSPFHIAAQQTANSQ